MSQGGSRSRKAADYLTGLLRQIVAHTPSQSLPSSLIDMYNQFESSEQLPLRIVQEAVEQLLWSFHEAFVILDNVDFETQEIRAAIGTVLNCKPSNLRVLITSTDYGWTFPVITCDNCNTENLRLYWHCGICNHGDYDLCQPCKDNGLRCLDSHTMIRCYPLEERTVVDVDACYPQTALRHKYAQQINTARLDLIRKGVSVVDTEQALYKEWEDIFSNHILGSHDQALTTVALDIAYHAKCSLSVGAFQHAVNIVSSSKGPARDMSTILEATGGLLVVTRHSHLKLMDHTLKMYLQRIAQWWFVAGHFNMASACLHTLITQDLPADISVSWAEGCLWGYASRFWGLHVREYCQSGRMVPPEVFEFLASPERVAAAVNTSYRLQNSGTAEDMPNVGWGLTNLHVCSLFGLTDVIRQLDFEPRNLDARAPIDGRTPLMYAAGEGYADTVRVLLDLGADPNSRTDQGLCPLLEAVEAGHTSVVRVLLSSSDLRLLDSIYEGRKKTALMSLVDLHSVEILRTVLSRSDLDINEKGHYGRTALGYVLGTQFFGKSRNFQKEATRLMIEHPHFKMVATDDGGRGYITQLIVSPDFDLELLDLLLCRGANINQRDASGEPAIFYMVTLQHNLEATRMLLENGADPTVHNDLGDGLLHRLVTNLKSSKDFRFLHLLLSFGVSVDSRDARGRTPLHRALILGKDEIVEELLDCGADVITSDNHHRNAFDVARQYGRVALLGRIHSLQSGERAHIYPDTTDDAAQVEATLPAWVFQHIPGNVEKITLDDALVLNLPGWSLGYLGKMRSIRLLSRPRY